ncbi:MAG: hypothetical protein JWP75_2242 [Frondihabitans sp.]|nr:hypothetical protein [Frondihabitans sp.]
MNYYRSLAFELRLRGLSEQAISTELTRIADLGDSSDPVEKFGSPSSHASLFERQNRKNLSSRLILVGGILLLLALVTQLVALFVWRTDLRVVGFPFFGAMLPVFGLLLLLAFGSELRLPKGFRSRRK